MGINSEMGLEHASGVYSAGAVMAGLVSCLPAGIWVHWEGGTGGTGKCGGWLRELWQGGFYCCH